MDRILQKVPKRNPVYIKPEELQKLWECATPWIRIMIAIGIMTGMRHGEICNLRWDMIDWARRVIKIQENKTDLEREVPISETLWQILIWLRENYIDYRSMQLSSRTEKQGEYVFCHSDGRKINGFRFAFNKARSKAGLNHITPHLMRHTFASKLVGMNVPIFTVQNLLGHKNTRTTMVYSHLDNNHLQQAVNQIDFKLSLGGVMGEKRINDD